MGGVVEVEENTFEDEPSFGLRDLLATLMDLRTLPHVLLLVVLTAILYALAQGTSSGTTLSAISFLSLSAAYALTAILTRYESVHRFVRIDGLDESSWLKSLMLRSFRVWALPLGLSLGVGIALSITTHYNEGFADWLPLGLASLFLIWSAGQALSFRSSTGTWLAGRVHSLDRSPRSGGITSIATTHLLVLGAVTIALAIGFGYAPKSSADIDFSTHLVWIGFTLFAIGIQAGLLYWLRGTLTEVSSTHGGARFALTWGITSQAFVIWHLTSAWRRLFEEPSTAAVIIEEALLMTATVILAIWALSSRSVKKGGKLFTSENALFWGLSFGFGYAGSIAMITRITDLFADGSLATTMAVGHIVTALTLILIHPLALSRHALRISKQEDAGDDDEGQEGGDEEFEINLDDLDDLDIPEPIVE